MSCRHGQTAIPCPHDSACLPKHIRTSKCPRDKNEQNKTAAQATAAISGLAVLFKCAELLAAKPTGPIDPVAASSAPATGDSATVVADRASTAADSAGWLALATPLNRCFDQIEFNKLSVPQSLSPLSDSVSEYSGGDSGGCSRGCGQ